MSATLLNLVAATAPAPVEPSGGGGGAAPQNAPDAGENNDAGTFQNVLSDAGDKNTQPEHAAPPPPAETEEPPLSGLKAVLVPQLIVAASEDAAADGEIAAGDIPTDPLGTDTLQGGEDASGDILAGSAAADALLTALIPTPPTTAIADVAEGDAANITQDATAEEPASPLLALLEARANNARKEAATAQAGSDPEFADALDTATGAVLPEKTSGEKAPPQPLSAQLAKDAGGNALSEVVNALNQVLQAREQSSGQPLNFAGAQNETALAALAGKEPGGETGDDAFSNLFGQNNQATAMLPHTDGARALASHREDSPFARLVSGGPNTEVLDQVLVHIRSNWKNDTGKITIQLDPAELGRVDVQIHVGEGGRTGLKITADQRDTLDMLQRDARALERALTDIGLKTEGGALSFNLRGDQNGNSKRGNAKNESSDSDQEHDNDGVEAVSAAPARTLRMSVVQGLDITV